jgi:predicted Rossmann fold nucleotide-binding protein DprA/Smf involved in DNA uptake
MVPPDTQAVLLLCGTFARGQTTDAKPLTPTEYNAVASWLSRNNRRPASLLQNDAELWPAEEAGLPASERVKALLDRGFQMAAALEGWQRLGLWVLSRADEQYPERLRRMLRAAAPPLLYGAGDIARLDQGGLAVVGSRDIDEDGLTFTRRIAERCAGQGVQIVSGGARGVDQAAVAAALDADGGAVAILSDRLDRAATSRDAREPLRRGQLTLVTPYTPESGFTIGKAMGRNKLIYALSDYALVVRFTSGEGGAWSGAVEQLGRNKSAAAWVPVFVRPEGNPTEGYEQLRHKGAFEFPQEQFWTESIAAVLHRDAASATEAERTLFDREDGAA